MSVVLLTHSSAKRDGAAPGTWFLSPVGVVSGGLFGQRDACMVNIKCPQCGKSATLRNPLYDSDGSDWPKRADGTRGHDITTEGVVSPSVVCPHAPCSWHVYVKLEGWATAKVPTYDED